MILKYHFHGNAMSDFKKVLSFHLIYSLWWLLNMKGKKATKNTFCDKGQNSCYDVDLWGALLS